MLVVETRQDGAHVRAECSVVHAHLDALCKAVQNTTTTTTSTNPHNHHQRLECSSQTLTPSPRPPVTTSEPEAVLMPLNSRTRESAQLRFSQLREHRGRTRRLYGSPRFLGAPSGGGGGGGRRATRMGAGASLSPLSSSSSSSLSMKRSRSDTGSGPDPSWEVGGFGL